MSEEILSLFYTEEERQKLDSYTEQITKLVKLLPELWAARSLAAEKGNEQLSKTVFEKSQYITDRCEELENRRAEIIAAAEKRYIAAYKGNPDFIFDQIKKIITSTTKREFIHYRKFLHQKLKGNYSNLDLYIIFLSSKVKVQYRALFATENLPSKELEPDKYNAYLEHLKKYKELILQAAKAAYPPKNEDEAEVEKALVQKAEELIQNDSIESGYFYMREGKELNTVFGMDVSPAGKASWEQAYDPAKNKYYTTNTAPNGVQISLFGDALSITPTAKKLLGAINKKFTESRQDSRTVYLPIREYMQLRKLSDYKATREQAVKDLHILSQMQISLENITYTKGKKNEKETKHYIAVNIAECVEYKDGVLYFTYSPTFFDVYKKSPVSLIPDSLFSKSEAAFSMGLKIANHKRMNRGKTNEDIIAVSTLLGVADNIPKYENLKNRNVTERIIEPFERALDEMTDCFSWEYCHAQNTPLSDEEATSLDYKTFSTLNIHFIWKNYPGKLLENPGGK